MATQKITLSELNLNSKEFKEIMNEILNSYISLYQRKSLRDWEKNHNSSNEQWKKEIERINQLKNSLNKEYKEIENESNAIDIAFSINLDVIEKELKAS